MANVTEHDTLDACLATLAGRRLFALSTKGRTNYATVAFAPGDVFLLGPETAGLPAEILESIPAAQRLRIPMNAGNRSLNLSNAAAVVIYEAWRQHGFPGAS
jgi:tRNA (cytidine/uridine-2'-O-)-methyltransferase